RFFSNAELRVIDGPSGRPRIVGYAAVFNARSGDLGGFREEIAPGAFTDALAADGDVLALVEHNPGLILGRRSSSTLSLQQDARGLRVEIDPPNTTVGNDAIENVRRGDIKGMSFRFPRGAKDSWRKDGSDSVRTLHKVGLLEVTLTSIPAYDATSVSLRALDDRAEAELRSYYEAQIAALTPPPKAPEPPAPAATPAAPDLGLARRRVQLLAAGLSAGEARAMMQMDDKSLIYCSRGAIIYLRQAFDGLQSVIDCTGAVAGALTPADRTAIDDCIGAVIDLLAKAKMARQSLQALGAQDDAGAAAA
ncbi:MAG TPA: HK97 family phage prohead protease, partial [Actinomycetota bacterium]